MRRGLPYLASNQRHRFSTPAQHPQPWARLRSPGHTHGSLWRGRSAHIMLACLFMWSKSCGWPPAAPQSAEHAMAVCAGPTGNSEASVEALKAGAGRCCELMKGQHTVHWLCLCWFEAGTFGAEALGHETLNIYQKAAGTHLSCAAHPRPSAWHASQRCERGSTVHAAHPHEQQLSLPAPLKYDGIKIITAGHPTVTD